MSIDIPDLSTYAVPHTLSQNNARYYRVHHITQYSYNAPVSTSFGRGYITPRNTQFQNVLEHKITIDPAPVDFSEGKDYFGNNDIFFKIDQSHQLLIVDAHSTVEIFDPALILPTYPATKSSWEDNIISPEIHNSTYSLMEFALDNIGLSSAQSLLTQQEIFAYTQKFFPPQRPILEALIDFNHHIYLDWKYVPGSTSVSTPISEIFENRQGVCQDFARIAIAGLRSLGLAAQYVSGYIATEAPAGGKRMVGVDASHAWARLWIADKQNTGFWIDFDPTNDQLVNNKYITTGWGRDYADIAPLKGVIYTDSTESNITVSVDVQAIDKPEISHPSFNI